MMKWLLVLWLGLTPLCVMAQDNNDVDELLQALAGVTQLQGRFLQSQYGEGDVLLEQSSGSFRLLRPGHFAWEIQSPDSQLIIADPQFIWHHDRDLETVTRRPVGGAAEMTPLQILGGDEAVLRESFQVQHNDTGDFVLTPISDNVGFKQLTLHMQEAVITGMDIRDNLDQRVVIVFSDLDSKTVLSTADFGFSPPAGVDLFYYDE
jgi:outer membrane lipoprotein carrier protein